MDHLCIDFINTDWHDWRVSGRSEDRLHNAEALRRLIQTWHLPVQSTTIKEPTLTAMKNLRVSLRRMVQDISETGAPKSAELQALNALLSNHALHVQVSQEGAAYGLTYKPIAKDWEGVMVQAALSFAQILASGEATRLKICENEDCLWVFFDESKNRSRRWCADSCGNLLKVRRFRSRAKANAEGHPIS